MFRQFGKLWSLERFTTSIRRNSSMLLMKLDPPMNQNQPASFPISRFFYLVASCNPPASPTLRTQPDTGHIPRRTTQDNLFNRSLATAVPS